MASKAYVKNGRVGAVSTGGALTSTQKAVAVLAAVLVGPSVVKQWYEKPAAQKVDLSAFNIVTKYDTPAIERRDDTCRIEFCAS